MISLFKDIYYKLYLFYFNKHLKAWLCQFFLRFLTLVISDPNPTLKTCQFQTDKKYKDDNLKHSSEGKNSGTIFIVLNN